MGTTHNYRYVDTTTVYQLGYNVGNNEGYSRGYNDGFEIARNHIKVYEYTATKTEDTGNNLQSTAHFLYINSNPTLAGKWIIAIGVNEAIAGTSTGATTETRVWYNEDWEGATPENPAITVQWRDKNGSYNLSGHFTYSADVRVVYFEP